ncbi:hypothetical protein GCM10027447_15560 [Glycomyces halotolerans]
MRVARRTGVENRMCQFSGARTQRGRVPAEEDPASVRRVRSQSTLRTAPSLAGVAMEA